MASLNQAKVIKALEKAVTGPHGDFIYDFLRAYGSAASTVKLLQLGDKQRNLASVPGDIAIRVQSYFRAAQTESTFRRSWMKSACCP